MSTVSGGANGGGLVNPGVSIPWLGSGSSGSTSRGSLVIQPPFAPQIQNLSPALGTTVPLQRGYMIWGQKHFLSYNGGPLGDGRDMINFLFNPSTVSTDYNVGNASLQAAMMYTVPGDSGNLLAPLLMQTVSFQLYFDRTYELNYGGNSSAVNDPAVIGVQADVYQFMQFTGLLANLAPNQANQIQSTGDSAVGNTATGTAQAVTTGGIMMMIPCYVVFGNALQQMYANPNSANWNATQSQMVYFGYISEWSVQYTHFTQNMVPIRAVISVNFTMLPTPSSSADSAPWRSTSQTGVTVPDPHPAGWTPPPNYYSK